MTAVLTTLTSFDFTNGAEPQNGLIADANGDLFGTAFAGGANNDGTVFELVNNNGTYTRSTLATFNGSNGAFPASGLIADANGDLFGTTEEGGANNDGTVFELVNNNGTYTVSTLASFDGSNGEFPLSGLIADANGDLFGTTEAGGGTNGEGTVFELVKNNGTYTLSTLATFNGSNGASPFSGSLIADAKGDLFGTTQHSGERTTTAPCSNSSTTMALTASAPWSISTAAADRFRKAA